MPPHTPKSLWTIPTPHLLCWHCSSQTHHLSFGLLQQPSSWSSCFTPSSTTDPRSCSTYSSSCTIAVSFMYSWSTDLHMSPHCLDTAKILFDVRWQSKTLYQAFLILTPDYLSVHSQLFNTHLKSMSCSSFYPPFSFLCLAYAFYPTTFLYYLPLSFSSQARCLPRGLFVLSKTWQKSLSLSSLAATLCFFYCHISFPVDEERRLKPCTPPQKCHCLHGGGLCRQEWPSQDAPENKKVWAGFQPPFVPSWVFTRKKTGDLQAERTRKKGKP